MFTGLVQDIGIVTDVIKDGDWKIKIKTDKLSLFNMNIGSSIACAGVCMTIIAKTYNTFQVQASAETLSKTTVMKWASGTRINLEPALRVGEELGGHLVTGHIDGVAFITAKEKVGDSIRFHVDAPHELSRFIAPKGSVALDGVSLTVNEIDHALFTINIIPHTQTETTLGGMAIGDGVNIEVDMMARYIERLSHPQ
ncbi:MAG: riboflavin synthase [Alphaproteobacteria bacterium]|nr:riboflavin synthase [Alphaproteobacteria bacterium]